MSEQDEADLRAITQTMIEDGDIWALLLPEIREAVKRQFMRLHGENT